MHLLAVSEGVCRYMAHMDTLEQVTICRQAALMFKLSDCLDRLMRIEQHFCAFERLSKFDGKTPQAVEDEWGQKTLVASDFIEWARGMGWIADDMPTGDQAKAAEPAENVEQRQTRLLAWWHEEVKKSGEHGAVQR